MAQKLILGLVLAHFDQKLVPKTFFCRFYFYLYLLQAITVSNFKKN